MVPAIFTKHAMARLDQVTSLMQLIRKGGWLKTADAGS